MTETEQFAEALRVKIEKLPEEDVEHLHASLVRIIFWLNREGVIQVQRTCPGCRYYEKKGKHHFCRFLQTDLLDKDLRIDCPEFEANG